MSVASWTVGFSNIWCKKKNVFWKDIRNRMIKTLPSSAYKPEQLFLNIHLYYSPIFSFPLLCTWYIHQLCCISVFQRVWGESRLDHLNPENCGLLHLNAGFQGNIWATEYDYITNKQTVYKWAKRRNSSISQPTPALWQQDLSFHLLNSYYLLSFSTTLLLCPFFPCNCVCAFCPHER